MSISEHNKKAEMAHTEALQAEIDRLHEELQKEKLKNNQYGQVEAAPDFEPGQSVKLPNPEFRMPVDKIDHGFVAWDGDFKILAWNKSYEEIMLVPEEFLYVGQPVKDIIRFQAKAGTLGPGDQETLVEDRFKTLTSSKNLGTEFLSSKNRIVQIQKFSIPGFDGMAVYTDVTDIKTADTALQRDNEILEKKVAVRTRELDSETHLLEQEIAKRQKVETTLKQFEDKAQQILSFLPMPLAITSFPEGKILYANSHAESAFGVNEGELLGQNIGDFSRYPDFRPGLLKEMEEFKRVDLREMDFTRKDGQHFTSLNSARIIDYKGETATIFAFTDITSMIKYEQALEESEEKFRILIAHAPEAIVLFDLKKMRYVDANDNALNLFKRSRDELSSLSVNSFDPEYQPNGRKSSTMSAEILKKLVAGEAPLYEWTYLDAHGQPLLCEVRYVRFEAGGRTMMRGSIVDIREKRRLEDQLQQSQKMEMVGQLTGGVAHDFNNILAVVLGNAELLEDTIPETEEKYQKLVKAIIRSATRGAKLTHQLLAFSRKQPLAPQILDTNEKIADLPEMLERVLGEIIETKFITDSNLWQCYADPGQLINAIMNLCVNARDAMPDGGSLTIETTNISLNDEYAAAQLELEPGEYIRIAVSDTGIGMSKEILNRVFEPFFTTKAVGQGTGLGLSMVFGFAKQSKGHVSIYSEEGHGTTVKLYIPRIVDEAEQPVDKSVVTRMGTGQTILVVEDDIDVRVLAVSLLSSMDYEIIEAKDGPSALQMLDHHKHIDLLFSDVILPGSANGVDIAKAARKSHPAIRVLFMSGYTEESVAKQRQLGDDVQLLQKPFRRADLANAVHTCLNDPQD